MGGRLDFFFTLTGFLMVTIRTVSPAALAAYPGLPELLPETLKIFYIHARNLPSTDIFGGPPDPFIQVTYTHGTEPKEFHWVARTSTLSNTYNGNWTELIEFNHYFPGLEQELRFEVRDHDPVDNDDLIGYAHINLDNCLGVCPEDRPNSEFCRSSVTGTDAILTLDIHQEGDIFL